MKDPIVEEIRKIRDEYAAAHGYDVHAIAEDARKAQGRRGRQILRGPTRRNPQPSVASG